MQERRRTEKKNSRRNWTSFRKLFSNFITFKLQLRLKNIWPNGKYKVFVEERWQEKKNISFCVCVCVEGIERKYGILFTAANACSSYYVCKKCIIFREWNPVVGDTEWGRMKVKLIIVHCSQKIDAKAAMYARNTYTDTETRARRHTHINTVMSFRLPQCSLCVSSVWLLSIFVSFYSQQPYLCVYTESCNVMWLENAIVW